MLEMVRRHEAQVLRRAGHKVKDVAARTRTSASTVKRVAKDAPIESFDDSAERKRRGIGRPSKVEAFRELVGSVLALKDSEGEPLQAKEVLRRARAKGYRGGKSAMYALIASLRPVDAGRPLVRFEGLAGEFSQHDFGEVDVRFEDGRKRRIHFFATRLKSSRRVEVSIVDDPTTETLVRCVVAHFDRIGGVPLIAVFDRPKTVAIAWDKDGTVTQWNQTFASVMLDIGVGIEVCWPARGNQKGSVENLVGYVKGSFFKQRTFIDEADLEEQLGEWLVEVNTQTRCRATNEIPEKRMIEERPRLRPLKVKPDELALRFPVVVGPTACVPFEGNEYMVSSSALGLSGTLYAHRDKVRIVVGSEQVVYPRPPRTTTGEKLDLPQLQAEMVAAVSGKRAKLYLMRQQLLEVGQPAVDFLTELVHRRPRTWAKDVQQLHALLLANEKRALFEAFEQVLADGNVGAEYVAHRLRCARGPAARDAAGGSDPLEGVAPDAAPVSGSAVVAGHRPRRVEVAR